MNEWTGRREEFQTSDTLKARGTGGDRNGVLWEKKDVRNEYQVQGLGGKVVERGRREGQSPVPPIL